MTTGTPDRQEPLRVLQVTPRFHPHIGGIETHVLEVSQRLAAAGVDLSVYTTVTREAPPGPDSLGPVNIERFQAWPRERDYCFSPQLFKAVADADAGVVHIQGVHTFVPIVAMAAARRAGLPYVVTFHTGGHSSRLRTGVRKFQWRAIRPLLASANQLIGVSQFEARYFSELLDIPWSRFTVVPNGAQLPEANGAEFEPGENGGGPRIVSVGRLERYKGHQRAIAAMPEVLKQEPSARLSVIGSGPYEPELRRLAQQLGVAESVRIRGIPLKRRQELAAELGAASLFLLLSDYEAHPVAVMEALYLRRPVLVTDTSGLREIADRGWATCIPRESSPSQVAGAILDQLRSPLIPTGVEFPTWEQCTQSLLSVYESVARRPVCAS
jgi:glycosyltransferase involved in cell wall biosynthesis